MELPFIEFENSRERGGFWGEDQVFIFGHVKFEVSQMVILSK